MMMNEFENSSQAAYKKPYDEQLNELLGFKDQGRALRAERDFLSKVLDTMDALVVILDANGRIIRFNQACERLFGYAADEIQMKLVTGELPLPKEIGAIKTLLAEIRKGGDATRYESQWVTSEGDLRTIAWSITALLDESGGLEYIFATGLDVTNHRAAEKMLEREKTLLHGLINAIPDIIFYKDVNGVYLGCNTAFETFRGCSAQDIVGHTDSDLYSPELAANFLTADRRLLSSGESFLDEHWTTNPIGLPVLFETRKTPYYGPDGEISGVIGIGRDITKHRMVENNLRMAKSEIEQLISSLSSILIVIEPDTCITQWNPKAQEVFGFPAEQVLGRPLGEIGIEWEWEKVAENISRCRSEVRYVPLDPIHFRRLDGKEGFLGISISPIRGEDQSLSGMILLCGDITERKILENRLAQSQKLESIGQLAAGIAHEINTPIQYIGDNTTFLQESFEDLITLLRQYEDFLLAVKARQISPAKIQQLEEAIRQADVAYLCEEIPLTIQQSLEGIRRVSDIVRAMKDFSHPGVKEKTHLDINKAIENTLTVTKNEWKYVAEIITDLDPALSKVMCLPGEINQAFLNILVNAAQAIATVVEGKDEKGTIKISTRQNEGWVEIRIADTGPGIPQEIRPRIFEPFFTTKDVGKGTGQGLAIAYDVVERKHKGVLAFETQMGQGTTFIIRLPVESVPEE